jgi:2,3-diketo-5-methylthio-1-phosphopentane phosphatase
MKKFEAIYCDFDGTITKKDAVNSFFEMFASEKWMDSEKLWMEGKISSKENAIIQVGLLNNVSQKQLDDYIYSIEIDDYFLDFVDYVKTENIKLTILSDGFDLFIKKVLDRYNLDIPYYANKLIYENGKFSIEFPYYNEKCDKQAGMCKCEKVKENSFCYIGDGTSDLCIASKADFLFASKNLHKYCKEHNIKHLPFTSFCNIIDVLKECNLKK